jgi:hypothetical protein
MRSRSKPKPEQEERIPLASEEYVQRIPRTEPTVGEAEPPPPGRAVEPPEGPPRRRRGRPRGA